MMNEQLSYYQVGLGPNPEEWVWSNSTLPLINPLLGGHPKLAYNFFTGADEKKNEVYFERGTLLHEYMEKPELFVVSEVDKPSEALGAVADMFIAVYEAGRANNDLFFIEEEQFNDLLFDFCREVGYQKRWGKEAIIKNVKPLVEPYVNEVIKNNGKKIISKAIKESLEKMIESLNNNQNIQNLLNIKLQYTKDNSNEIEGLEEAEVLKEIEVYYNLSGIKMKSKLDRVQVYKKAKTVIIVDYKTTSSPISKFGKTVESFGYYRQDVLYRKAIIEYLKQNNYEDYDSYKVLFYFVVVETSGTYVSEIFNILEDLYRFRAQIDIFNSIYKIKECLKTNNWNNLAPEPVNSNSFNCNPILLVPGGILEFEAPLFIKKFDQKEIDDSFKSLGEELFYSSSFNKELNDLLRR